MDFQEPSPPLNKWTSPLINQGQLNGPCPQLYKRRFLNSIFNQHIAVMMIFSGKFRALGFELDFIQRGV